MRFALLALCGLGLLGTMTLAQAPVETLTVEELLAKVGPALGVKAFPADHPGIKAVGKIKRYGLECDLELIIDGQGRFRTTSGGILGETEAFDGTQARTLDWCGASHGIQLRDRDYGLLSTWLTTGYWAAKPELFDLVVDAKKSNEHELVVGIKRKGGNLRLDITIDRKTWLPSKATGKMRDQTHEFVLGDYRDSPGLRIPCRWSHTSTGVTTRAEISKIDSCSALAADTFSIPRQRTTKATFDAQKKGKLEVKKVISGHLLVKPTIGGEDVGWFILDSGAGHSCIDTKLAHKLQLEEFGEVPVMGVGGSLKSKFAKSPSLELGPVTIKEPTYVELDLGMIGMTMGEQINGIIGYPVFQAAIVEIDCDGPMVTLHDPATHKLAEGACWNPLVIDGNHPIVECKYEGDRSGWFRLDTGATDTVSFHTVAVRNKKLLEGRKTSLTMQGGVGGMVRAQTGKLDWFELAGHRFENPRVVFSQVDKGALADEYLDGNLGQIFFRPFRIVFNYGDEKIAFVRKQPKAGEP